ncbi:MAG TPA: LysE family transporter, partial [Thermomicrobiales bacterium]
MDIRFLIRGMIFGLSIAAPVGPMGVLCIRRTLADGRLAGFISGLGTATADACYGAVAAFGLTFVTTFLVNQQSWLRLIGGSFLCYLGVTTFLSKPAERSAAMGRSGLRNIYVTTFGLTLTNPLTILTFAAIFAGIGVGEINGAYGSASLLVLGVFLGSALWWLILSSGMALMRTKLTPARL